METIVVNIREIGIFMIAAQAVMHFAPGKQYEKYIKLIASVIVLLLFINPFVSGAEDIAAEWEYGTEQMMRQLEEQEAGQNGQKLWGNMTAEDTAMQQLEEEVRSRLNFVLGEEPYRVAEAEIQLEEITEADAGATDTEWSVACIRITMEREAVQYEEVSSGKPNTLIKIDDIVITADGDNQGEKNEEALYRRLFADTLGIGENRVEVICRGGW